ncbi:unnamed protein product [Gordionus sp. m RMFG-2023]
MRMWEKQEIATKGIMVTLDMEKEMMKESTYKYYREKDSHLITYESGTRKTQIDYMLISRRRLKDVIDCKVIPGEDIAAHMDLQISNKSTQNKIKLEPCIKWGKLRTMTDAFAINANIETINCSQVSEKIWTDLSSRLIDIAKSTLGLKRGGNKSHKNHTGEKSPNPKMQMTNQDTKNPRDYLQRRWLGPGGG